MLTMNLAILDLLNFSLARVLYFEEVFCIVSKDAEQPRGNLWLSFCGARNACEAGAPGAPLGASQVNQDSGHALVLSLFFLSLKVHYITYFFKGLRVISVFCSYRSQM